MIIVAVQGFWVFGIHITEQKNAERATIAIELSAVKRLSEGILETKHQRGGLERKY